MNNKTKDILDEVLDVDRINDWFVEKTRHSHHQKR